MIIIIVSTPVAVDPRRQVGSANPPILEVGSRLYIEPSTIRNRSTFYVKHTKMQDFGQNYSGDATPDLRGSGVVFLTPGQGNIFYATPPLLVRYVKLTYSETKMRTRR